MRTESELLRDEIRNLTEKHGQLRKEYDRFERVIRFYFVAVILIELIRLVT